MSNTEYSAWDRVSPQYGEAIIKMKGKENGLILRMDYMPQALSTRSSLVFPTMQCLHVMNNRPWSLQLRSTGAALRGRNCLLHFREKEAAVGGAATFGASPMSSCPYHLSDVQQLHLHFLAQGLPVAVGLASWKCWSNDHTLPSSFQPLTDGSLCRNTLFPLTLGDSPEAMGST